MKYNQSDFVVYNTISGNQVYTWVKSVFDEDKYYILDFEDTRALESEITSYDAPNYSVPNLPQDSDIDDYHRDTMIDRIVTALQPTKYSSDPKVYKLAGTIVLETEVTNPDVFEDKRILIQFIEKHNRIITKVQERFSNRWNVKIPVELRVPLNKVSLNAIKI